MTGWNLSTAATANIEGYAISQPVVNKLVDIAARVEEVLSPALRQIDRAQTGKEDGFVNRSDVLEYVRDQLEAANRNKPDGGKDHYKFLCRDILSIYQSRSFLFRGLSCYEFTRKEFDAANREVAKQREKGVKIEPIGFFLPARMKIGDVKLRALDIALGLFYQADKDNSGVLNPSEQRELRKELNDKNFLANVLADNLFATSEIVTDKINAEVLGIPLVSFIPESDLLFQPAPFPRDRNRGPGPER